jgi:hypothetical protein
MSYDSTSGSSRSTKDGVGVVVEKLAFHDFMEVMTSWR